MAEEKNSSGEEIMEDGLPGPSLNKQSENALRRRAERLGFELHKSRRRDRQAPDYDRYALIDLVTKKPLGGTLALVGAYHFTAEAVKRALDAHALALQAPRQTMGVETEKGTRVLTSALLPVQVEQVPKLGLHSKAWAEWCANRGFAILDDGRAYWQAKSVDVNPGDCFVYLDGDLITVAVEADLILERRI